jgi:hypothetical protein
MIKQVDSVGIYGSPFFAVSDSYQRHNVCHITGMLPKALK